MRDAGCEGGGSRRVSSRRLGWSQCRGSAKLSQLLVQASAGLPFDAFLLSVPPCATMPSCVGSHDSSWSRAIVVQAQLNRAAGRLQLPDSQLMPSSAPWGVSCGAAHGMVQLQLPTHARHGGAKRCASRVQSRGESSDRRAGDPMRNGVVQVRRPTATL